MCGIAGFISAKETPERRGDAVGRMCAAMLHRGPDDAGMVSDGDATLGMRRLAIFDPANGHQPMVTPGGRFHIVFNGAIYNFRALRDELAATGVAFRTNCDTEVLLAAYAHWGDACLPRLRGMFAFAVWDSREQSLFLARDAFGIKPLYYRQRAGELVFASELNALHAAGLFVPEIDPRAVADYLAWFAVPAPRTIYRDVFSLRPGESATFCRGRLDIRSAWSFRTIPKISPCTSRDEFAEGLRSQLEGTIRAHLVADVPVGAFLSGGLDSAVVVGLMARASSHKLKTFSIGFDEAGYSEASAAAETARHYGTDHHASVLTGDQVARDLEQIIGTYDQPTGDGINTFYASKAAREGGVTVALSGLGGDELFGGYPSFQTLPKIMRWLPLWRSLPAAVRQPVIAALRKGDTRSRKLADILRYARNVQEIGAMQRRVFSEPRRLDLLSPDTLPSLGSRSPFHPELGAMSADLNDSGMFAVTSAWELRTYMADVLLRDNDVMSMHHSLELRVPFVDRPLIEWLWNQPAAFKGDLLRPKSALANATRDIIPPALLARRKRGFSLPFAHWIHRELRPFVADTFSDGSISRSGLFNPRPVQELWRNFQAGTDDRQWSRVWSLAVLITFINRRTAAAASTPVPAALPIQLAPAPPSAALPRPQPPVAPVRSAPRHRTLLMAPEIFASEGGIPRILQIYLKALCDLAEPDGAVRLIALNDGVMDTNDLRRCANDRLEDWRVCSRKKTRFVQSALRMSRGCDRIVCGHVFQLPVALAAKALNPRLRYYLVAHGIEIWRPFKTTERLALWGAEKILCVSDYTRQQLLHHCPLPEGRAVVLPNALDPFFAIAPGIPLADCPPTILVVTRLTRADRYKGVEHMIQAMPAILARIPGATLRIIGRGDDFGYLNNLRDRLGLQASVSFLGYVDDRQMTEELRSCRLFALPSKKEGFGLVFLEAMANGRPCLGARAGGIPEVIDDASGVMIEFGDLPGIAAAAVSALQRDWDETAILNRAREFSYSPFKARLASLLGMS
jgi:asparagine synthase (glutamine-hydrolysing)